MTKDQVEILYKIALLLVAHATSNSNTNRQRHVISIEKLFKELRETIK